MDWKQLNDEIAAGYGFMEKNMLQDACTRWLDAWETMKQLMSENNIETIEALNSIYQWGTEVPSNFVQDLEMELHNAAVFGKGSFDPIWCQKRIRYCEELIPHFTSGESMAIENTRRAIAESYGNMGDMDTAERLLLEWLSADPEWGWGYIGRAELYLFRKDRSEDDIAYVITILKQALEHDVRNREIVMEWLGDAYGTSGDAVNMKRYHQESVAAQKQHVGDHPNRLLKGYSEKQEQVLTYEMKPGRNDPCPCGSGKKYKKCCGK